jgi:hypothetical protein
MKSPLLSVAAAVVCSLALAAGCGRGVPSEVRGRVLLDGHPLPNASVQFISNRSNPLGTHSATTDLNGYFRFAEGGSSHNPLQPGSYVVLVSKTELPPDAASLPKGGLEASVELVPKIYQDRTNSPLQVEITAEDAELPPLELKTTGT